MITYKVNDIEVTVLGSVWTVKLVDEKNEPRFDKLNCNGFCDYSNKTMVICNDFKDYTISNPREVIHHIIAHELVHAFMFESGLAFDWEHKNESGQEETVVDWIAWQFQKINQAYARIIVKLIPEDKGSENSNE